jgi:DNA-binding response OmpR family regulator
MNKENYILLIEDNDDDIELTKLAFNENKFANDIKVIKDGEEALNFLLRKDSNEIEEIGRPTFILLDINLPKVNGLEILEHIKKDSFVKHIPVIMLTTSKQDEDIVHSYDLGANSYVRKPVNYQEFVDKVNNLGIYWLAVNQRPYLDD